MIRVALLMIIMTMGWLNLALAETIEVDAQREAGGQAVEVRVHMSLPFNYTEVWDVLNDYEHMPQFVQDIQETTLLEAEPKLKRVRIKGNPALLIMHFPIEMVMDVKYLSATHVRLESHSGNFGVKGDVYLYPDNIGTHVIYIAQLRPSFWLPPLIGSYIIRRQIHEQFKGQVAEMHRRYDSRKAKDPV